MEQIPLETNQNNAEQISSLERTNNVLQKLFTWGLIAFNSLSALETQSGEIPNEALSEAKSQPTQTARQAMEVERRFEESGLIETEPNHPKPVVAITTKESIFNAFTFQSANGHDGRSPLSEAMMVSLVEDDKLAVTTRNTSTLKSILKEVGLGASGLIDPDDQVKLGQWRSADFYIVTSERTTDNENMTDSEVIVSEKVTVFENEIIDMKTGASITITVEAPSEDSDTTVQQLAKMTEDYIKNMATSGNGEVYQFNNHHENNE